MVVFYKYIYTELLLCRSSWGWLRVAVQDSLLHGPSCLSWVSGGWGSCLRWLEPRVVDEDTHPLSVLLPQALILP